MRVSGRAGGGRGFGAASRFGQVIFLGGDDQRRYLEAVFRIAGRNSGHQQPPRALRAPLIGRTMQRRQSPAVPCDDIGSAPDQQGDDFWPASEAGRDQCRLAAGIFLLDGGAVIKQNLESRLISGARCVVKGACHRGCRRHSEPQRHRRQRSEHFALPLNGRMLAHGPFSGPARRLIIRVSGRRLLADAVEKVGGVSGSGSGLSDRTICRLHRLDIVAIDAYASV
jgi:hypothetical protein